MRIISGTHKGRQIKPDKNFTARPTTDFAKENIFNVLSNYYDIEDCRVLDLFAGTGSISYEFASRGAISVTTVELNYKHFDFIKRVVRDLKFDNIDLFKTDAFIACRKLRGKKFDIIFADPPYQLEKIDQVPDAVFENELLGEEGLLLVEHSAKTDFSAHPRFVEKRVYGCVNFSMFK